MFKDVVMNEVGRQLVTEKSVSFSSEASVRPHRHVRNVYGPESDWCSPPSSQIQGHQSVFINEPRLSDFKQVLLKEGIQAEFVGGVLVCNNMVAVRRVSVLPTGSVSTLSVRYPSGLCNTWLHYQ